MDLLLLKISPSAFSYVPVKRLQSARRFYSNLTVVSTSMYQDGAVNAYDDQITSKDGPSGYTWSLRGSAALEQSGAPIFTSDGTVIGVMSGVAAGHAEFVPIEIAATLLAPIRLDILENDDWLRRFMHGIVAYSYSSSFELGSRKGGYNLRFFKNVADAGKIDCEVKGSSTITNRVFAVFNEMPDLPGTRGIFSERSNRWEKNLLPGQNADLFPPPAPPGSPGSDKKPNLTMISLRFNIEDVPPSGTASLPKLNDAKHPKSGDTVNVSCVIDIVGLAQVPPHYIE
jgi:hypothetical protein